MAGGGSGLCPARLHESWAYRLRVGEGHCTRDCTGVGQWVLSCATCLGGVQGRVRPQHFGVLPYLHPPYPQAAVASPVTS